MDMEVVFLFFFDDSSEHLQLIDHVDLFVGSVQACHALLHKVFVATTGNIKANRKHLPEPDAHSASIEPIQSFLQQRQGNQGRGRGGRGGPQQGPMGGRQQPQQGQRQGPGQYRYGPNARNLPGGPEPNQGGPPQGLNQLPVPLEVPGGVAAPSAEGAVPPIAVLASQLASAPPEQQRAVRGRFSLGLCILLRFQHCRGCQIKSSFLRRFCCLSFSGIPKLSGSLAAVVRKCSIAPFPQLFV
jgi:hypothetical protein